MRHMLIDSDTASDDAVALVMALRQFEVQIEAITIVCGNVPTEQALQNALYTAELCGADVPIYAGAAKPILRPLATAQFVHGKDGMGDIGLPLHGRFPEPDHAVDVIIRLANQLPQVLEVVTIGPLTNLAIAILREPSITKKIKHCVVMGGVGEGFGNVTPVSEYNIWADPEAAKIVFSSGLPIKMVGWDIARKYAYVGSEELDELAKLDTPLSKFAVDIQKELLQFAMHSSRLPGFDLPDPIAMAIALDDALVIRSVMTHIEICCADGATRGQTIVDHNQMIKDGSKVEVVLEASRTGFLEMLYRSLA